MKLYEILEITIAENEHNKHTWVKESQTFWGFDKRDSKPYSYYSELGHIKYTTTTKTLREIEI